MTQTTPILDPGLSSRPTPPSHGEAALRTAAVRRVKQKKNFRDHLVVYILVNAALWTVWLIGGLASGFGFPWPVFPTVFWGLFVLGQANDVYWSRPVSEDAILEEMRRLREMPEAHVDAASDDEWR